MRARVTPADLGDPTQGITTPRDTVAFDEEEIALSFPSGTTTLTVTRSTTDDDLNHGNTTYHAVVLAGPEDSYTDGYRHTASTWVQDDDRPVVTVTAPIAEIYGHAGQIYPYPDVVYFQNPELYGSVTLTRTGDASSRIRINASTQYTDHQPAPVQDKQIGPGDDVWNIPPGETSTALSLGVHEDVNALGRTHRFVLIDPHYCPDNPSHCGYGPQYTVGSPQEATFRSVSYFMGVRIEADQSTVGEGETATITLHRHGGKPGAMDRPLHVNVGVTQEGDYTSGATPETVTFQAGQSTATLSVPTSDDGVDEPFGVINATILRPASYDPDNDEYAYETGIYLGTPWAIHSVTTAVTDTDYVPATVSVADGTAKEFEGAIEFTVSLDQGNNDEASSVDWATQEVVMTDDVTDDATAGVDFTAASGTVNFAIGEMRKTVTVTLLDDDQDENHERFNILLSKPSNLTMGTGVAIGTILDDELAFSVLISTLSREPVVEGQNISVRIRRMPATVLGQAVSTEDPCHHVNGAGECFNHRLDTDVGNDPLTINIRVTQEGDVLAGPAPTTVTFEPGSLYAYVILPTDDDATVERDAQLLVDVLNGPGYSPIFLEHDQYPGHFAPSAYRTVYDNDLLFSIDDVQAAETADALDFTVSLNAPAPKKVSVDVSTVDGDATSHGKVTATSLGQDFTARSETITFLKWEQTKTFSVALADDSIQEEDETFTVKLSNPPEHATLIDGIGVGTIVDDEEPMVASVTRAYSIVDEDQGGPVRFMVELSHPDTAASEREVSVGWDVSAGTATKGEDYLAAGGVYRFPVGTASGFLDVILMDDNLFEEEFETFTVELIERGTSQADISTTGASFEANIRDNETLAAGITAESSEVAEGQFAVFRVTLTGGPTAKATKVQFDVSGNVTAGEDYGIPLGSLSFPPGDTTGSTGTLVIPAGRSSGTITFPIPNDRVVEEDETLTVDLFRASAGQRAVSISPDESSASAKILDVGSQTVSVEGPPFTDEGLSATFTVYLAEPASEDITVEWSTRQPEEKLTAAETAKPGADFPSGSGTVTIPAGETSATFKIQTTDDRLAENAETFRVKLEGALNGAGMGSSRMARQEIPGIIPLGITKSFTTILEGVSEVLDLY